MDKKITAQEAAKAVLKKAEEMLKSSELAKANRSEEKFGANKDQKEIRRKIMNPGHPNRDNEIKDGGRENVNHPTDKKGVSHVGEAVRRGATKYAKSMVQEKINSSKFQTKMGFNPDLAKEQDVTPADGVQKETIGQHDPAAGKENSNPPWGTEPGCHKLSKFMGRREEKAKKKNEAKSEAAPMDKAEGLSGSMGKKIPKHGGISPDPNEGQKGVHENGLSHNGSGGVSVAGQAVRSMNYSKKVGGTGVDAKLGAKAQHGKVLRELKAMPKPNLTKEEEKGFVKTLESSKPEPRPKAPKNPKHPQKAD